MKLQMDNGTMKTEWNCEECGTEVVVDLLEVIQNGEPVCENECGKDGAEMFMSMTLTVKS